MQLGLACGGVSAGIRNLDSRDKIVHSDRVAGEVRSININRKIVIRSIELNGEAVGTREKGEGGITNIQPRIVEKVRMITDTPCI